MKIIKKKNSTKRDLIIYCLLLGLQSTCAIAQTRTITGNLINGITREAITGAIVIETGSNATTISAANGDYSLIIPDTIKMVKFADFAGMEIMEIKIVNSDVIDIYLTKVDLPNLSLEELLKVKVVTASKKEQSIEQAPAIITVITAKQIEERGYQSVGEALNSVAGIYPLFDYLQYNIGVRGVNGGQRAWSRIMKVMINSQPISFRPDSESFLGEELIPTAAIERIEIIRGPASALYGANAFLGVINIITKSTNKQITGHVEGKYGVGNRLSSNGINSVIYGKSDKFNYFFSGTYKNSDRSGLPPLDVPGATKYSNTLSENDQAKPFSIYSILNYTDQKAGSISLDFNYQNLDSYGEFQDWGVLTHNDHIQLTNYFARVTYEKRLIKKLSANISIAYARGSQGPKDKLAIDTIATNWITRKFGNKSLDVSINTEYAIKKRTNLKLGVDFTNDFQDLLTYYTNQFGGVPFPQQGIEYGDTTFRNTGIFIQAMLNPSELINADIFKEFEITTGIRYDVSSMYDNVLNYRIAAVYQFNKSIYTKLLYGTSYKAPSSVQLYSNYVSVGGVIGNPELKPEKAQTIEWCVGIKPLEDISVTTTVFYNIIRDKVELILPYGTVSNVSYDNIAKINSAGAEIELLHKIKRWMNYANISYQRSILTKDNLTKDEIKIKTELYPDIMLKFGSNLAIPKAKLNLNLEGEYISPRIASQPNNYVYDPVNFRTNRYELPAYFTLNAAVSSLNVKLIKDFETRFLIKINNLLNTKAAWPGYKDFDIPFTGTNTTFSITQKF